jgi:hypothetical protein
MTAEARLVRLVKRDERYLSHMGQVTAVEDVIQIKKLDHEEQVVFGEVYAPSFPDSQGDFMTPDEIKKMAYNFLRKGIASNIDVNHTQMPSGSYVVESFLAREGDPTFIPGSWVLGVKVPDQAVWQMVKSGELNGFSLDGIGVRTPKALVIEMPELLKGETDGVRGHTHSFVVKFDQHGNFLGGYTNPALDGHMHQIVRGTVTEPANGHAHRFSFVEGVLNVAA